MTNQLKNESYIEAILSGNKNIFKYEIPLIMKAMKKTLKYFCENGIEFHINDVCDFVKHHKKESNMYIRYRDEHDCIPEHETLKFKLPKTLKDYLNCRNKFKNVAHREYLPDGITRTKKIG